MSFEQNLCRALAHSQVFFSREDWKPVADAQNIMPNIGASIALSSAAASNPFEEDGTWVIFGNDDNPTASGDQTPSNTSTATATTAMPGATATSNVPISTTAGASSGTPGVAVSGFTLFGLSETDTWILIGVTAAALLGILFFFHEHPIKK